MSESDSMYEVHKTVCGRVRSDSVCKGVCECVCVCVCVCVRLGFK